MFENSAVLISAGFKLVRAKVSALVEQRFRVEVATLNPNFVWGFKGFDSNPLSSTSRREGTSRSYCEDTQI